MSAASKDPRKPSTLEPLMQFVAELEASLQRFYDLPSIISAGDCLLTSPKAEESTRDGRTYRAAVLVEQPSADELFLGIHLSNGLIDQICNHPPLASLNTHNLDAFCAIAEEISHFHLIAFRANTGRGVSKLELEFQGELDKVLLAASLLHHQHGHPHWEPLVRLIFDHSRLIVDDEHYAVANRLAGQFWYHLLPMISPTEAPLANHKLRVLLREQYHQPWELKFSSMLQKQAA